MNENQIPGSEMNQTSNQNNANFNGNSNTINNPTTMGSQVPPINPVEVSNFVTTDSASLSKESIPSPVTENSNSSNKPPKNNKVSTILLILLFVFLFAFIMGMPYIKEFIHDFKADTGLSEIEKKAKEEEEKQRQEEESKKPTPTPEDEKTTELTCTSSENIVGNATVVEIHHFYYNSKKQILSSKEVSQYRFTVADTNYLTLIQECDQNSLKYLTHEGYTMSCKYGDTNIEISHEFDLKTFTPIIDGITNIQANATYKQNIDLVKEDFIGRGYTCK